MIKRPSWLGGRSRLSPMPGSAVTTTFWSRLVINTPQATVAGNSIDGPSAGAKRVVAVAEVSTVMEGYGRTGCLSGRLPWQTRVIPYLSRLLAQCSSSSCSRQ
ncbi:hypothetical protein MPLSOD_80046 [Mesorhizobium sp. SOD10]|nr:hypothetical protein MPLSOD_80046 [Mesorhizobium sp. SOD10]